MERKSNDDGAVVWKDGETKDGVQTKKVQDAPRDGQKRCRSLRWGKRQQASGAEFKGEGGNTPQVPISIQARRPIWRDSGCRDSSAKASGN
jgi:hypothetical protein